MPIATKMQPQLGGAAAPPLHSAGSKPRTWRSESVQGAKFVPVKIAKIGQIELTRAAFAHARRAFTRRAASSKASRMPGICLSGRRRSKTDRHAIGARRVLAINGFCDGENAARRSIKDPVPIDSCGRHAKRTQYRIIESFRALQVIGANHDVGKHRLSLFCESGLPSIPIHYIGLSSSTGPDVKKCSGRPQCSARARRI
jgi:hypothetical protein